MHTDVELCKLVLYESTTVCIAIISLAFSLVASSVIFIANEFRRQKCLKEHFCTKRPIHLSVPPSEIVLWLFYSHSFSVSHENVGQCQYQCDI